LAFVPPQHRDKVSSDLGLLRAAFDAGVVPSRSRAHYETWTRWRHFCDALGTDDELTDVTDPVLLLQIFAQRYRDGRVAPRHRPVRSRTVEDALRAVAQGFTRMGARDPRLTVSGKVDFRIQRQLRGYKRAVLHHLLNVASRGGPALGGSLCDIFHDFYVIKFKNNTTHFVLLNK
jgi:hypothetical protein